MIDDDDHEEAVVSFELFFSGTELDFLQIVLKVVAQDSPVMNLTLYYL